MNRIYKKKQRGWKFWVIVTLIPTTLTLCFLFIGNNLLTKRRSGTQFFEKGQIYASAKKHTEAIEAFKKALKTKPNDIYIHYNLGISYMNINDHSKALDEFATVLKINPEFYEARLQKASINIKNIRDLIKNNENKQEIDAKIKETENICKEIIDKKPEIARAYTLLADINIIQGSANNAIKNYKKALNIDKSLKNEHLALARLYFNNKEFDLAKDQCNIISSQIEPDNYQAQILLSEIFRKQGNSEKSIECLNKILSKNPGDVAILTKLGLLYFEALKYKEAYHQIEQIEKSSSSSELSPLANFVKGSVLVHRGDYTNAIFPLTKAAVQLPKLIHVHYYLATAMLGLGRVEQAKSEFNAAIEIDSKFVPALLALAKILEKEDSHKRVIELCQTILEKQPRNIEVLQLLGSSYVKLRDYRNAEKQYGKLIDIQPDHVNAHLNLGIILETNNLLEESIAEYKKVIELDPTSSVAYNNLAWIYINNRQDMWGEALLLAKKAKELSPASAFIIDTLGWVYYLQGMYDKSIQELEMAINRAPNNPTIRYHLGMAYQQKGLKELAQKEMKRALDIDPVFPEANEAKKFIEKIVY